MNLTNAILKDEQKAIIPNYNRDEVKAGIVHFGPGAFHRAHQAYFFDKIANDRKDLGITEVSLHSTGVRDALNPQDGLYVLASLDKEISYQIIGIIKDVLVAPENPQKIIDLLVSTETKIITSTITEKGYGLKADGSLDVNNAEIKHDIENLHSPKSYIGYLVAALAQRFKNGTKPFIIIPCDNLPSNGKKVRAAIMAFASITNPEIIEYLNDLIVPSTMVDSITPATDEALKEKVFAETGIIDAWPIQREAFTQWVIEKHETDIDYQKYGIIITNDVASFERAKLKLLNGAHSSLAYLGILKGHESVFNVSQDYELFGFIREMMKSEIKPMLKTAEGMDLDIYIEDLLSRFSNSAIVHKLEQIAWDGSQKLPIRILDTINENLANNISIEKLSFAIAAWFRFIAKKAKNNEKITDPLSEELMNIGKSLDNSEADLNKFFALTQVFSAELINNEIFKSSLKNAYLKLLASEK